MHKRLTHHHYTSFILKRSLAWASLMLLLTLFFTACGEVSPTATTANNNLKALPTADMGGATTSSSATVASTSNSTTTTASDSKTITIRVSYPGSKDTGNGKLAAQFAALVSQKTGGKVQFQFYPDSSIAGGDQLTAVNMVESNKIEAVVSQASFFTTIDPAIEVLGYPFLFSSRDNAFRFIQSEGGKQLLSSMEQYNFKTLAFGDQGFRQVSNSKRPINTPADLAGLKVRIPQSNLYTKVFKALGAEPVTMNFSPELYKALQNKSLDGQDAPINFTLSSKYQEVQSYMTLINYSWDPLLLNVSLSFWNSLPADIQKAFQDAGTEVTKSFNSSVDDSEKAALDKFQKAGMQITTLTPGQLQAFADTTKPLYASAETQFGKDFMDKVVKAARGS